MNKLSVIKKVSILFIIFFFIFQNHSYAYLDPGTGSIILQAIAAGIVGVITWLSFFKEKLKNFLKKLFKRKNHEKEKKANLDDSKNQ